MLNIMTSFFPVAILRGRPYQNNSNVTLEDIGEGDDALLCITDLTACCQPPYTGEMGPALGNWFFPNGTIVFSGDQSDFFGTRGQMVVRMNRRRGGVEGIYRCEIPDAMNVTQTIYIGVYSISTGEWLILYCSTDMYTRTLVIRSLWDQMEFPNSITSALANKAQYMYTYNKSAQERAARETACNLIQFESGISLATVKFCITI